MVTAAPGSWVQMPGSARKVRYMARRLAHGMGSFFKECECVKPTRCPHPYAVRFRDATGRQRHEAGFRTQDDAIEHLTRVYAEKRTTAPSIAEARRELGQKTVAEYAQEWRTRQRKITEYSTGEHVNSSINAHIVPRLGSRKMATVTPMVVERFLNELEADGVGRGNQTNIFRTLKAILRDAFDKGAMVYDPVKGVQEPEYVPQKVVVPTLAYVQQALDAAGDDLALEIVMMAGCGLRNGEARAVNVNNLVAADVYRVHNQIHSSTHRPAKLKHRKAGEFREVPLPRSVREAIERHESRYGSTHEGYLLRGPSGYYTEPMERRRIRSLFERLPAVDGLGMYGFRHYFASNALGRGIPITDVAEWMGHKSIEETYRTYRHLMPGSITRAARILDAGLRQAA
ncbi:tyrosine-type recombinase/integrase [Streptomyces sp. NBC_01285]|uniref:tyrosine-type recombinase/integrase n=1 Tax=Streptomyces sp. NBC_01285 TaxID=2903813 RepID=UPI00224D9FE3|nr:tyrosine-type recombinase/integrase [Streptomyces sp. NBC_01285]MCX4775076.1 site-specific integrase [Streptomyces sp. NBC_01285]